MLPPAQDHKKIFDSEKGKNTGGMGSFAPASKIVTDEVLVKIKNRIIEPVLKNMKEEGHEFKGCLYCGLMIDKSGDPQVIEFNLRFGDPETQVVVPLVESDFLDLLLASAEGNIKSYNLKTSNRHYCSGYMFLPAPYMIRRERKRITGDCGNACTTQVSGRATSS